MKVYISVDMEGIAGVNHPAPTGRGDARYPTNVGLMVGEANAAIEGALAGGADDVVVNDSHGGMYNLIPADLNPAARVLQGQKAWSMVAGAGPDAGIDVALFVGYHARAGHPTATIAHTYTGRPTLTMLNGDPVGLVAGDDALADEIGHWLPWAERVVVKDGIGSNAALSHHPSVAQGLVRAGAERAVRRAAAGELKPLAVSRPVTVQAEYHRPIEADYAALIPGAERYGDRGVSFSSDDPVEAYRAFLAGVRLADIPD